MRVYWLRLRWALADLAIAAASMALAFLLRFDFSVPERVVLTFVWSLPLAGAARVLSLLVVRAYRRSWLHASAGEFLRVGIGCATGSAIIGAGVLALTVLTPVYMSFPRSVLAIDFALALILIGGLRLSVRALGRRSEGSDLREPKRPTLIVGAGDAGAQLVRAMQANPATPYRIVGFIDDDAARQGGIVRDIRILGRRRRIPQLVKQLQIETVLIAMPSAPPVVIRETVDIVRRAVVPEVKIIPYLSDLYSGRVTSAELRELRPEDMLRREPIRIEGDRIRAFLDGKRVLVTGAAGSIGSELCRQILAFGAGELVAVDFDETGLFDLDADLRKRFSDRNLSVVVCDVRDRDSLARAFQSAKPQVVYHAAAYKHVPMMEAFPAEAAKTNVFGTRNVLEEAENAGCEAFVLISTDKAVEPSSVMGATKRVAEMIVQSCRSERPRSIAVRFGNVLGSRGSVLGTFQRQVQERQPVTVTDAGMRRYFMVTSEAVQLVLQASALGETGDVLVLDMGDPVAIIDLARDVIRFYGYEPDVDIPIVYTGFRPGEKLYEDMFTDTEGRDATSHERVFVARLEKPGDDWGAGFEPLEAAAKTGNISGVIDSLKRLVPSFRHDEGTAGHG